MMHKQSESDQKVRDMILANPDLPILVLSNDVGGEYDTYWHFVTDVYVTDMIFPGEIEKLYGDAFGLNIERWYDDEMEAADDIEGWLWDSDCGSAYCKDNGPHYQYFDWAKVYSPIARMMAEDMPKHKYLVIKAEL